MRVLQKKSPSDEGPSEEGISEDPSELPMRVLQMKVSVEVLQMRVHQKKVSVKILASFG